MSLISFGTSFVPPPDREVRLSGGIIAALLVGGGLFLASRAMGGRRPVSSRTVYSDDRPTLELPVESMRTIVHERRR